MVCGVTGVRVKVPQGETNALVLIYSRKEYEDK